MGSEIKNIVYQDWSDISQLILRWGYYRDHGMWNELLDTFHGHGEIRVTWYVGQFSDFVEASKEMAKSGSHSMHVMKPSIIDVSGDWAGDCDHSSFNSRQRDSGASLVEFASIRKIA